MTTPYANLPITDSSGRKYADRGITLPQLLPGAFKEVYRRRAVPACIVLPHSLLCSFFSHFRIPQQLTLSGRLTD